MTVYSHPSFARSRPPSELALRVEKLLSRYPDISEQELTALIDAFPNLPILDYGLMTADDRLSQKLSTFERDQKHRLRSPLSALIAFLAVPVVIGVGLLWWMLI